MSKFFSRTLLVSPAFLAASLLASSSALAANPESSSVNLYEEGNLNAEAVVPTEKIEASAVENNLLAQATQESPNQVLEQIDRYSREGQSNSLDQVTNVNQFRDVQPTDWAFEALRSLVERYGCIVGYPDRTFRGNRALTRYEFAAGLNACLQQIERLIAAGQAPEGGVSQAELQTLQRLVQEFEAELATLGTRVDNLEARTGFLEQNQFSTTTRLRGEAIFALTDVFGDGRDDQNTVFGNRVRLSLNTSFTGQDQLVTRLSAGNLAAFGAGTGLGAFNSLSEGYQTFNLHPSSNLDNDIAIDWLAYYVPVGGSQLYLAAVGGIHSDYAEVLNPYFNDFDGGNGALSTFAQHSPIYRIGGGAGAGITLGLGPLQRVLGNSSLTVGFLSSDANTPVRNYNNPANSPSQPGFAEGGGLTGGDFAALGQLNFNLGDRVGLGLTYVRGSHSNQASIFNLGGTPTQPFDNVGVVGTDLANNPLRTFGPGAQFSAAGNTFVTDSYGVQAAFRLTDRISISGFGMKTDVNMFGFGDAELWSYGAGIAFADFGRPGNVLGIFGGAQPYAGNIRDAQGNFVTSPAGVNPTTPIHVEAFYKYQLNDNISVTPGVIWLSNPSGDAFGDATNDAFIGTLRTTFTF